MARPRTPQWATQVGRRARRTRSAVEAPLRQLGHSLWQRAPVRLRLPGTPRVGPTRHARNGPVALAYDLRGRGSPLVLIQGVGVGRWGWEPVADRLARRFQVITIDNRGIGASDGTVASGPKVRLAGSKVELLPSRRLPEVLKAINLGIADGD